MDMINGADLDGAKKEPNPLNPRLKSPGPRIRRLK
jgi:hypothetical protein